MGYTYTSNGGGTTWETSGNWSSADGGTHYPGYEAGDTAVILAGNTFYVNAVAPANHLIDLIVLGTLVLYNDLTVDGACMLSGTVTDHGSPYLHAPAKFGDYGGGLGSQFTASNDRVIVSQFTAPSTGTLAYLWGQFFNQPTLSWRAVCYDNQAGSPDVPHNLLGQGPGAGTPAYNGWSRQSVNVAVVQGTKYWLGWHVQNGVAYNYQLSGGTGARLSPSTFGTSSPSPFGTPSANTAYIMQVIAEYAQAPTGGPFPFFIQDQTGGIR